jgi:anti-sigma B factor antagonist
LTTLWMEHLTVCTHFSGNAATVIVDGELDVRTAPELRRALTEVLDKGPERLILDLADVTFIDCASARVLAAASRALPGSRKAVIRRSSRPVRRVLALTGITACF